MLKQLLKKVKQEKYSLSQKSEPIQNTKEQVIFETSNNHIVTLNDNQNSQEFDGQKIMKIMGLEVGNISKIRYGICGQIPNIWNKVIGCPISTWNLLTHSKRKVKQIDLRNTELPQYLRFLKLFLNLQLPNFNHLLINYYPEGVGIMPHTDGPAYHNKVVVLSLKGPSIITFESLNKQQKKQETPTRLLLQHNSIHIFENDAYSQYMHGINFLKFDSVMIKEMNGKVIKSNIDNIEFLRERIQRMIKQKIYEYQNWILIQVIENQEFNWKIEIKRQERISITIRQKLQYEQ